MGNGTTKKKTFRLILVIAICVIAVFTVVAVPLILGRSGAKEKESVQEEGTQEPAEDTQRSTENTEIMIVEEPEGGSAMDSEEPPPGEVLIVGTLQQEIKNYGYDKALFHVKLRIYSDVSETFEYNGKTLDEYRDVPILELYREVREDWKEEIYIPLDREMVAAEQSGEEYAQGWEKHDPDELFREYFYENQPDDVIAEYEEARQQQLEAHNAYSLWMDSEEPSVLYNDIVMAETERLSALGFELKNVYDYDYPYPVIFPEGYLTRRQIEEFPASDKLGYWILWADRENEVDA